MSSIDQQRREAVRLLHSLGYVYAHRWTTPANANPIINAAGYYSAGDPRLVVNVTTRPCDAMHGVFIGEYTTFENYSLGDVWSPAAWRADGVCLVAPSPEVAFQLRLTQPTDLADFPQP